MRKLLTLAALLAIAAATFGATSAIVDSGSQAASAHRVCIRIHRLRWCFGARSARMARAVKATYRADRMDSLTLRPGAATALRGTSATFTCTQPKPGAYDCTPAR